MDIFRKMGTCIVMMVPTFVGSGAVWDIFRHSGTAVILWIVLMAVLTWLIVSGKILNSQAAG